MPLNQSFYLYIKPLLLLWIAIYCTDIVKEIASINVEDGIEFIKANIISKKIKEDSDIDGV